MAGHGDDGAPGHGVYEVDAARLAAHELCMTSAVTAAAIALARLNVFQTIAAAAGDGEADRVQLTAAEISTKAVPGKVINVAYLERLLRVMSVANILRESNVQGVDGAPVERRYGLGPVGRYLVDDGEKASLQSMLLMCHASPVVHAWARLEETMVEDEGASAGARSSASSSAFARANGGQSVWEYCERNPEFGERFQKGMEGHSRCFLSAVLDVYGGFEDVKVLVDVGGGLGTSLELITARFPHVKGINFDRAHVQANCPVIPGVEHMDGDFFELVPAVGDAILLKQILHDWNDEESLLILKNCHHALPPQGKLIIMDIVLNESNNFERRDALAFSMDVTMMTMFGNYARERSERDLRKLVLAAGFLQVSVVGKVDHLTIMECYKAPL